MYNTTHNVEPQLDAINSDTKSKKQMKSRPINLSNMLFLQKE